MDAIYAYSAKLPKSIIDRIEKRFFKEIESEFTNARTLSIIRAAFCKAVAAAIIECLEDITNIVGENIGKPEGSTK